MSLHRFPSAEQKNVKSTMAIKHKLLKSTTRVVINNPQH